MDLNSLKDFPFLQSIGGLLVLIAGAFGIVRAARDKRTSDAAPTVASQADERDFAKLERDLLRRELEDVMRASRESIFVEIGRVERQMAASAKEDRHELKNIIQAMVKQFEEENKELEKRIRDLEVSRGPR